MNIQIENGDPVVMIVSGQSDTLTAVDFEREIQKILASTFMNVVLDVGGLTYVSSAGLRLLLTLQKRLSAKGGTFVVKNVKADIMEIFNITGFSSILTIE
ncbi:MAG: STAS domain-containing protein [Tannerellaceae bacterium]|nr:STAS domain-containing protein [Tannerellaceae bacterium]